MNKFSLAIIALASVCVSQAHALEFDEGIFHYATVNDVDLDVKVSLVAGATVPAKVEIPTEVTFLGKTYNVTHLAGWMFSKNETIVSVKLPERMTTFEYAVFEYCKNLKTIVLPESLKWIGNYCFIGCESLENIVIPENVEYIGQEAFEFCSSLSKGGELRIPDAVTTLGINAFAMGPQMTKLVFGAGIETIPQGVCCWDGALTDVVIPHNVKTIMPFAFQGTPFTRVNVGAPEVMAASVFDSCEKLMEVEVETTTPPVCVENTFPATTYTGTLIVPDEGCIAAYKADEVWGKFATIKAKSSAVESVMADENTDSKVYNLQGVYVGEDIKNVTTPGIYVSGGKKFVVK